MLKKELCSICKFYAVSPIHAGSGSSTAAVDLPIQRERHTNWPHIQASGVKGAFRAHFRNFSGDNKEYINLVFGSDKQDKGVDNQQNNLPGAFAISDAKLLAFPMRSNIAPFVWVTSPAVLKRFQNDLNYVSIGDAEFKELYNTKKNNAISIGIDDIKKDIGTILEDATVNIIAHQTHPFFEKHFPELKNLLLISDEMYDYAVSYCAEVQTNIKIDSETGTAKEGALRYQEFLPADSILYSIVYYSGRDLGESNNKDDSDDFKQKLQDLKAATIKEHLEGCINEFVQIGGDETLGKGICKISWIKGGKNDN